MFGRGRYRVDVDIGLFFVISFRFGIGLSFSFIDFVAVGGVFEFKSSSVVKSCWSRRIRDI